MDGNLSVRPIFYIMMKRKVKIKIFATIRRGEDDDAEKDNIRMTGNGMMTLNRQGRIEIRYDEITGDDGPAINTLSFDVEDSGVITLVREGIVSSVMTFSENKRYGGNYRADFAAFEFTVATKRVSNTVTFEKGGQIILDYNTEIQGVALQSSCFRFDIACIGNDYEE